MMPKTKYQPLGGNEMPRFGGPATMMRLPSKDNAEGLDVCFAGVPFDIGTSNRPGARFGPRQIRAESALIRPYNMATRAAPFDSLSVADIGDVAINTFNMQKSLEIIEAAFDQVLGHNCKPLTLGGDHTIVLPILRAMKKKYGAVGLIHVDAHADVNDTMFNEKIAHGTPFRRAVEEELLDPAFAPGTGTPEIGGLTVIQAIEILRGCRGLNIIGGDLVEVSPPYDSSGNTALVAANLLYELLCSMPGVEYRE